VFALLPALIASLCIAIIVWKREASNSTATGFWAGILAGVTCSAIMEWVFYLFLDSVKTNWLANIVLSVIIGRYLVLAIILSGLIGIVYSVILKRIYRHYFNMPLSIHYNETQNKT
jgi:Mg/Co/Ni transporter MgtE